MSIAYTLQRRMTLSAKEVKKQLDMDETDMRSFLTRPVKKVTLHVLALRGTLFLCNPIVACTSGTSSSVLHFESPQRDAR